jgi:AraC-like DNA-binding protein
MPIVDIRLDILTLIGILGAAQAVVVGTALLTTRGLQTRLFGLLLLSLGCVMAVILYSHAHPGREPLGAVLIETAISLIAPVLFFSFVVIVTRPGWTGSLPAIAVIPAVWIVQAGVAGLLRGPNSIWIPPIEVIIAYQIASTVISAFLVVTASADRPDIDPGFLRWARTTVAFMAVINAAQIVRLGVDTPSWRNVVPITSGLVVIALTFVAARHSRVFLSDAGAGIDDGSSTAFTAAASDAPSPSKYGSSSLSDEEAEKALARFRHSMEGDRAYLRADLSLDRLAEELGLARTYLSQVINERCERPFHEVVADYRVEEARRILSDDATRHVTVEAVGQRSGFQSKSAYYSAFKKRTGLAPAEYRRRLRREGSQAARQVPPQEE